MYQNYYVITWWHEENEPGPFSYYTVTMLGEDHPRYVNGCYSSCLDWASNRAQFVSYPGDLRMDAEDYLLFGIYNDTGTIDGMAYEVLAVFRIED